jgi:hypothetical protein
MSANAKSCENSSEKREVAVVGLTLRIGGQNVFLTVEEGKKLKEELDKFFGIVTYYLPYYQHQPLSWPAYYQSSSGEYLVDTGKK